MKHPAKIALLQLTIFAIIVMAALLFKPTMELSEQEISADKLRGLSLIPVVIILFILLKEYGMKLMLLIFYFISLTYFFNRFVGAIAPILALIILAIKTKSFDVFFHNLSESMAYIGFAWCMLPALPNMLWVAAFAILLAIYDFISVFKTRHMVRMLNLQMKMGMPTALIIPYSKTRAAILGGGDVIVASLLTLVASNYGVVQAIATFIGACIGLLILLLFGKRKKVYPALPTIVFAALLAFALSLLL